MGQRKWTCLKCGKKHEDIQEYCTGIGGCGSAYIGAEFSELKGRRCPNCKHDQYVASNLCFKCGTPLRANRLADSRTPLTADAPQAILCHVFKGETMIVSAPDPNAERLYAAGIGNVLRLEKGLGSWRAVTLPEMETGYAAASSGFLVEVALGAVESPLGYARLPNDVLQGFKVEPSLLEVRVRQPGGEDAVIHRMNSSDRLPIVAETKDSYLVQLPNGMRGWVSKTSLIRTLSPDSLPKEESESLIGTLFGVALVLGLGAANRSAQKNLIADGVSQGIRQA